MPYITLPACAFSSSPLLRRKFCGKSTSSIQQMTSLPVWERAKVRASRSDADHAGTVTSNVAQWETSFKGNSMKQIVKLKVNGVEDEKAVQIHHTLLEVLRSEYKLFGAREGCGIGMCGACTVLLDGQPMSSCILLAALAEGKEITTIEGL